MILAGIIPAHAGLTDFLDSLFDSQWDHPRACGAHDPVIATIAEVLGSSPRMRGSPWRWYFIVIRLGIIPAHAGLTQRIRNRPRSCRDHPRACGAHPKHGLIRRAILGSSPRMRGSLVRMCKYIGKIGIIPAHAGLTWESRTTNCSSRDHPRACGAHVLALADFESRWGSSPRMRGSQARTHAEHGAPGIIPAHAGLTKWRRWRWIPKWDHPRACGAHFLLDVFFHPRAGSSPRMRGSPP